MSKNISGNDVEEKIINAAIECIEKYGIQGVTNRQIAAEAGVNSAAINYYFRSKEALLERCREITLKNAFDWESMPELEGKTNREKCILFFSEMIEGGLNYPGISRFHLYDILIEGNYEQLFTEKVNNFVVSFSAHLAANSPGANIQDIQMACIYMITSILLITLTPGLFKPALSLDLTKKEDRQKYITSLVDKFITA